jgi:hypothetical protein
MSFNLMNKKIWTRLYHNLSRLTTQKIHSLLKFNQFYFRSKIETITLKEPMARALNTASIKQSKLSKKRLYVSISMRRGILTLMQSREYRSKSSVQIR